MIIKIADISVELETPYSELVSLYKPYQCEEQAQLTIKVTPDELIAESELSPHAPKWEIFGLATYRKLCIQALKYDCILFHSSAVAVDGKGYLFSAPSGTGKSTHSFLWKEMLGPKLTIINDDKPLLRLIDGNWLVCGTPWNGKHNLGSNKKVPIEGICFLKQSNENEIFKINNFSAIPLLLNQMLRPKELDKMDKLLELTENLINQIPMWQMHCLANLSAAAICYKTMKGSVI